MASCSSGIPKHSSRQVEPNKPVVDQLQNEVFGHIETVNSWMVPFLKLLEARGGNDISHFIKTFNSSECISFLILQFFLSQKLDKTVLDLLLIVMLLTQKVIWMKFRLEKTI